MDQRSVFVDEWRRSLREQYKHVVRSNDRVTLPSLTAVMLSIGFGEDELNRLRLAATIRAEDVDDNFTPDLDLLDVPKTAQPHPAECLCPQCLSIDDGAHDADGQPIQPEPAEESTAVYPAASINQSEAEAETEPITFEDSLALAAESNESDESEQFADQLEHSEDEPDPDAPLQMDLF